jgi:hypothetical protein
MISADFGYESKNDCGVGVVNFPNEKRDTITLSL